MLSGAEGRLHEEAVTLGRRLEPRIEVRIDPHRLGMHNLVRDPLRLADDWRLPKLHARRHEPSIATDPEQLLAVLPPPRTAAARLRHTHGCARAVDGAEIDLALSALVGLPRHP